MSEAREKPVQFEHGPESTSYKVGESAAPARPESAELVKAAREMDWQQVVLNGGPPCFYLEGEKFCERAQRWAGHDLTELVAGICHKYVPLDDLLEAYAASELARLRAERYQPRYVPNPRTSYKCAYCNELARLSDANVVVDSYSNVCHLACFDREVAHLLTEAKP